MSIFQKQIAGHNPGERNACCMLLSREHMQGRNYLPRLVTLVIFDYLNPTYEYHEFLSGIPTRQVSGSSS